jgi:hypothetical protein
VLICRCVFDCCMWFTLPLCRHLSEQALHMTDDYISALPVCVRSAHELRAVITETLQILGTGSSELQQLAAKAVQDLRALAAAPAGTLV